MTASAFYLLTTCSLLRFQNYIQESQQYAAIKDMSTLVPQMVKNLPAMQETQVQSLSWKDPQEEGMATHSSILAWRIPMGRGTWWAAVHGVTKGQTQLSD